MFRRFLIAVLIFLIAVLVAADRLGAIIAAHVLAGKVQTDEHLPHRPSASIGGFPFITQALGGKYKDVKVEVDALPIGGVSVTSLTVQLHGVHVSFGDIVHDKVQQVPVDRIDGTAFLAFADLDNYLSGHHPLGQQLSLRPGAGNAATLVDRLRVGHKVVALRGVSAVSLRGNVIDLRASHFASTAGGVLDSKVVRDALKQLKITVPLNDLPFQISLDSVRFTSTGVTVTGGVSNVTLGSDSG